MTVLNVNVDTGFNEFDILRSIVSLGGKFVEQDRHGRTSITYSFLHHGVQVLDFKLEGHFDKDGETGRIDHVDLMLDKHSLAELTDIKLNLEDVAGLGVPTMTILQLLFGFGQKLDVNGGRGNDVLLTSGGEMHGGRGDDTFYSAGVTHYDGGSGMDTVSYYNDQEFLHVRTGITVSLLDPSVNTKEAKGDTYNSIENLAGTTADDRLFGSNGANKLLGDAGHDILIGGKGKDHLDGGAGNDFASYETAGSTDGLGVIANLRDQSSNQGDAKGDTYVGIEGLIGSANRDILTGDDSDNVIKGGAGDDLIDGAWGDDELWGDSEVFGVDSSDTFAINAPGTGLKTIMDFDVFDMIKIDRAGFGLAEGYQLIDGMTYIVADDAKAQTEHWTFLFDTKTSQLYFDEDGNGSGDAVLLAKVNFHSQQYLDTNDFLIV